MVCEIGAPQRLRNAGQRRKTRGKQRQAQRRPETPLKRGDCSREQKQKRQADIIAA